MANIRSLREPVETVAILGNGDAECVFHARNQAEAERYRSLLDSYGIVTHIGDFGTEQDARAAALAGLPLFVPASELERASEILARFDIEGADWDEEDDDVEDDDEEDEEDDEEEDEEDDDFFPDDDDDLDEDEDDLDDDA